MKLAVGKYKATVTVNKAYRDFFKIGTYDGGREAEVTVQQSRRMWGRARCPWLLRREEDGGGELGGAEAERGPADRQGERPEGPEAGPAVGARLGYPGRTGRRGHAGRTEGLPAFTATVWNAGPSPLVVDGFRQQGTDLMDAYQYFYDANGKQVGYTPTGTMEWDPREGHEHWHFTDFASYSLLDAEAEARSVRSGKEAFCLANTDAIDYTVKNANWHPYNTDLPPPAVSRTPCPSARSSTSAPATRTPSTVPGQSFDITDLPNGTYYIQVIANPENRLFETSTKNNVALRKVVLGGTKHHRTVKVPPVGVINVP